MIAICLVVLSLAANGDEPYFSKMSDDQLVDSLQAIKEETVGIDSLAMTDAFLAEDKPPKFIAGIIGTAEPASYPQMRILVQRGVKALPVLLRHLDDARPTQLSVPHSPIIMWTQIGEEYVPRVPGTSADKEALGLNGPEAKLPYVVKVGDVCFALIGQIVGRPLMPVRYQPTGGMIINSPVASKKLADEVRRDWADLTEADSRKQLIKDAMGTNDFYSFKYSLQRLRYYFPEEYARQKSGELKGKIAIFGKEEKEG